MNKINKLKLGAVAVLAALSALPYTAMAAVDPTVLTALNSSKTDAETVGSSVLVILVAIFGFKLLRKAL
ncbi:MAG: Inovirus Coat protein [Pseudomonadota bacterium]|jgi:NO-binding membrane sensor protein with MHYT domain